MRSRCGFAIRAAAVAAASLVLAAPARPSPASPPDGAEEAALIQPEELARIVRSGEKKPVIFQIGFRVLYEQAHIPGSRYTGPASREEGLAELRRAAASLPRDTAIVLYCGCCPWVRCPNVQPARKVLRDLGFANVKTLYIAKDFGADWVQKGYPVEKGAQPRH
jgi:thiosulfate/3-mercaptopyruvate sulfurtransferase